MPGVTHAFCSAISPSGRMAVVGFRRGSRVGDGTVVAIVDMDRRALALDIQRERPLTYGGYGCPDSMSQVWSPDERFLYIRYAAGDGEIVSTKSGATVLGIPAKLVNLTYKNYFAWSPDSRWFHIAADVEMQWHTYDVEARREIAHGPSLRGGSFVGSVGDGSLLAVVSDESTLSFVGAADGVAHGALALDGKFMNAWMSPSRRHLLVRTADWTNRIYRLVSPVRAATPVWELAANLGKSEVDRAAWSPDGTRVALSGSRRREAAITDIEVWSADERKMTNSFVGVGFQLETEFLQWTKGANPTVIDFRSQFGPVQWDLAARTQMVSITPDSTLAWRPDVMVANGDGSLILGADTDRVFFWEKQPIQAAVPSRCGSREADGAFVAFAGYMDWSGLTYSPDRAASMALYLASGGAGSNYSGQEVSWSYTTNSRRFEARIPARQVAIFGTVDPLTSEVLDGVITYEDGKPRGSWRGHFLGFGDFYESAPSPSEALKHMTSCPVVAARPMFKRPADRRMPKGPGEFVSARF